MKQNLLIIVSVSLISLFIFWLPFLTRTSGFWGIDFGRHGMETIVQNFDGLNFLIVAKSLYDPKIIEEINLGFNTGNIPIYFSAHYPLFGILIRFFEFFVPATTALLFSIISSNILLAIGLYLFFSTVLGNKKLALLLGCIALFFPARILSDRAVGSNEPLFMFFVLTSLTSAYMGKNWRASILGSFAILTRSPGIILFVSYIMSIIATYKFDFKKITEATLPYLLMPITLILLFGFYGLRYGDLLAYFHSGDNLHLFFPPFQIFSNTASWINGMWREDIIYLYLFYGVGIISYLRSLSKQCGVAKLAIGSFGILYGLVLILVSHRDLARYALPLSPIALLGYAPLLIRKEVKIIFLVLIIPIFLLGWQFVVANVQPISNWESLL